MSIFAPAPPVVHFFSYVTGISIELPVGFASESEDASSATYFDESANVRVQVRVIGEATAGAAADLAHQLADGFAASASVLRRHDAVVDDSPATTVVTLRADGWRLHQTVLAADERLFTVVGMVPPEAGESVLSDLDRAVESIRVVSW